MPDNNKQTSFNEDQLRKAIRQLHPIREKISVIEADAADKRPLEDIWFDLLFLENELESILKRREPAPRVGTEPLAGIDAVLSRLAEGFSGPERAWEQTRARTEGSLMGVFVTSREMPSHHTREIAEMALGLLRWGCCPKG